MMEYYRQGDIVLIPVSTSGRRRKGGKRLPAVGGRVILALGEVTGHAHVLPAPDVDLYETAGLMDRLLRVRARVTVLTHEEHAPITLPQGDYIVRRQREYSPGAIRSVLD